MRLATALLSNAAAASFSSPSTAAPDVMTIDISTPKQTQPLPAHTDLLSEWNDGTMFAVTP